MTDETDSSVVLAELQVALANISKNILASQATQVSDLGPFGPLVLMV